MFTQKLILSYGSKITLQFIQIAASIIVARVAGPTVLGTLAFGLAFVAMFVFLADLGIGTAHIKLVSEGQDLGDCIATFSKIKAVLNILFLIVVLGVYLGQKHVLHVRFESPAHEHVILILLGALFVEQFLYIPKTTFVARTEQAKADFPFMIREVLQQIFRIIIVLLGYQAVALAFGNLASLMLIIPLVYILYKSYPKGVFNRELALRYFRISLPVLFMGLSTNVFGHIDKVFLQYFTNSEQVGFYSAGYRVGSLVMMAGTAVGALFFPIFSKAVAEGDLEAIKNKIDKFERFSFLFIMPAVIFLSLFSDVIVRFVLGEEYLASVPVMMIINVAMFVSVLNMPYGSVLTGLGFFNLIAAISLINLAVFVSLLLILPNPNIFGLGSVGVALAVLTSQFLLGIVFRIYAKRKFSILDLKTGVKFMLFGGASFFAFYFMYNSLEPRYGMPFKLAFVVIYFAATYATLVLLGWIKKEDLYYLRTLANVKKLGQYVKEELGNQDNEQQD